MLKLTYEQQQLLAQWCRSCDVCHQKRGEALSAKAVINNYYACQNAGFDPHDYLSQP